MTYAGVSLGGSNWRAPDCLLVEGNRQELHAWSASEESALL